MSLHLNNTMPMLYANTFLSNTYGNLSDSIAKLSSGLAIETAADDPAKYVEAKEMNSRVATVQQGIRNANDAVSMLQVADGSLQIIDENLVRMKELAQQAATGTYNEDQRMIIDSEYQTIASEITRIAEATEFNDIKLLNGNLESDEYVGGFYGDFPGKVKLHYGAGNQEYSDYSFLSIGSSTAEALGVGASAGDHLQDQEAAAQALINIDQAIESKSMIRAELGSMQNAMEQTINNLEMNVEHLTAASSTITDTDIAAEMTRFTTQQMLAQTTISMIAQGNVTTKMALDILR